MLRQARVGGVLVAARVGRCKGVQLLCMHQVLRILRAAAPAVVGEHDVRSREACRRLASDLGTCSPTSASAC